MLERLRSSARELRTETYALVLVYRDPRTPWLARIAALLVVAYALSPIDLIPDFIPVIGHLDDLIIIPLGIMLTLRLVPPAVMADCREKARVDFSQGGRVARLGLILVVLAWLAGIALVVAFFSR